MSDFKVGDKVVSTREDTPNLYIKKGSTYTVSKVRPSGCIELEEIHKSHSYFQNTFELAPEATVLTPEEVLKHLRLGTKLEYQSNDTVGTWLKHSGNLQLIRVSELIEVKWRVAKVEPEVITLNGKKYKLIED